MRRCIFGDTFVPSILHPDDDINADTNADVSTNNNDFWILCVTGLCDTVHLSIDSVANTPMLLFYQGGLSSQLPYCRMEEIRWMTRMAPHSTTEEGDVVEDNGRGEDEDNEDDEEEEPTPQLVRKNPTRNCQLSFCCTHSVLQCQ
ncbi:hypothetical protein PVK06_031434 [Gossypium arboreum]|uniref:Uncharacterized protein n=1 Tax=Gossypium arboreum TaxID=29729 RepID=A0ABR0NQZ5_GOSAR|nr:hypothetical protein PVK06_031434 [Gossypium arboreum]